MGKALAQARNLYVEIIFLATFTVLALAVANLRQETDAVKKRKASTVFGRLYMAIRGVVSRGVKVKRAVMFERKLYSQDTFVYDEAPAPEPEPEPDPTPDVSPVADDTKVDTQTEDDLFGSNITIVIDETDDNTEDIIEEEPIHEFEPETPTPTPSPTPTVIDMAGPFDIDRIQTRISNVKTKLAKRIETVRQAMNALNENLNDVIICQESEVDVYLKQMGGQTNRGSLKFDSYLEGISIAKSHRNMWFTPITPPKTEFLFEVREKSHDQSISKISFGAVPVEKCVVKNFYMKIGYKKEADVFTRTFSLVSGAHKRQNFSMPIPLRFDTLTVIALDNNGNSTTLCLPEFRVYQHTGLL